VFAEEGTAAHELGEMCIEHNRLAASYLGTTITTDEGNSFLVNTDMAEAVQVYLDEVVRRFTSKPNGRLKIEAKFELNWIKEGMFGTSDCTILFPGDELVVMDYKHGRGVAVDCIENPQLMYYALGALGEHNVHAVKTITMIVGQPRAYHKDGPVRVWSIPVEELYQWADNILKPGAYETESENARILCGDHCKWCEGKAVCPEISRKALAEAKLAFKDIGPEMEINLPDVQRVPEEKIAPLIEFATIFNGWLKDLQEYAENRMLGGAEMPGMKLVYGRTSRKFNDFDAMVAKCEEAGLDREDLLTYAEPKQKTPAQVEKVLKSQNLDKSLLEGLVDESKPLKAVPLSAKGKPVTTTDKAADLFSAIGK